jgi:hypothetical protein
VQEKKNLCNKCLCFTPDTLKEKEDEESVKAEGKKERVK